LLSLPVNIGQLLWLAGFAAFMYFIVEGIWRDMTKNQWRIKSMVCLNAAWRK